VRGGDCAKELVESGQCREPYASGDCCIYSSYPLCDVVTASFYQPPPYSELFPSELPRGDDSERPIVFKA
jgi:hypothetical protein